MAKDVDVRRRLRPCATAMFTENIALRDFGAQIE